MADVQFRFGSAGRAGLQAYEAAAPFKQQTITSAASAVHTTETAEGGNTVCRVKAVGSGDVFVAVGVSIVASEDNGILMSAGDILDLTGVPAGSRGSVINKS